MPNYILRKSHIRRAVPFVLMTAVLVVVFSSALQTAAGMANAGLHLSTPDACCDESPSGNPLPYKVLLPLVAKQASGTLATITAPISTEGGTVTLPNYASVTFPANAFSSQTTVEVSAVSFPEDLKFFEQSTAIFETGVKLGYNIVIHTGAVSPTKEFTVVLTIPDVFTNTVPLGSSIEAFAQLWEDGGADEEILDNFELVDSVLDPTAAKVEINLLALYFTDERTPGVGAEAILTLATVPLVSSGEAKTGLLQSGVNGSCGCDPFPSWPLRKLPYMTSPFGLRVHPITGKWTGHGGVDLRANGDDVLAVTSGKIIESGYQLDRKTGTGWGYYLVLQHDGGCGRTLYAHLEDKGRTEVGTVVDKGQSIAKSDSSGGVRGPHLHVEYAPRGDVKTKGNKVDPFPYMAPSICDGGFEFSVASGISAINWNDPDPQWVRSSDSKSAYDFTLTNIMLPTIATARSGGGGGGVTTVGAVKVNCKCTVGSFTSNGAWNYVAPEGSWMNGNIESWA